MRLSKKQKQVIGFGNRDGSMLLTVGVIRSGKTFSTVASYFLYTQALNEPQRHICAGRKLRVIESEVIPQMLEMADSFNLPARYKRSDQMLMIGQQIYHVIAGNDETSLSRAQGLTIHSTFVDEATLVPESFFNTVMSRMTFPDSKAWVTCNPSYPLHWLKTKWLDEERIDEAYQFNFEDNPILTQDVIDRNKALFTGTFAKRMVDGLWAAAEGLVYKHPHVASKNMEDYKVTKTIMAVDYGTASTTAITVLQEYLDEEIKKIYVPHSEHVLGGTDLENKTDSEICDIILDIDSRFGAKSVIIDPSAASLMATMRKAPKRKFTVRKAKNDVLPGIRTVDNLFQNERLTVAPVCDELIKEINSYSWDDKKPDTVIKQFDHHCDAMRYGVAELIGKQFTHNVKIPIGY